MNEIISFGEWLHQRRRALDLTQDELAQRVGVAVATIRKIESDERRPSLQVAERLADQLAIGPAERPAFVQASRGERAVSRLDSPAPASAALPSGTITFLFTGIVGSTRLWEQFPRAMTAALARHDAILREILARHGGSVFKTGGDSFYAAFTDVPEALHAALEAQGALLAERWEHSALPDGQRVQVRMALHTGVVEPQVGSVHGPAIQRAADLLAAAHGSQILLSHVTAELAREHLSDAVELRDLGIHRLHDRVRAERIFQLTAADLPADFPPLYTIHRQCSGLPVMMTSLIGREREVAAVCDLFCSGDARLVTLTGPGGAGKTRVAVQVAAELANGQPRYRDGVAFVSLDSVIHADLVEQTIAQCLGLHDAGASAASELLQEYLRDKAMLLVLDNFEHVLDAAPRIAALLAAAPKLNILITSRAVLRISGEREFVVPPLEAPDKMRNESLERLITYPAVRLFAERAQAANPGFCLTEEHAQSVADICTHLDGLPLAIELAAARVKLFSPQALLARLTDARSMNASLSLLTGGGRDMPARQQTLRTAIDWSYTLLDPDEQRLFAQLGVFSGGWNLEAAEAICGNWRLEIGASEDAQSPISDLQSPILDNLVSLVDKSLVKQTINADGEPRFKMLETIREYALERLAASGEEDHVRQRHARYYLTLAEDAEVKLRGPNQADWLQCLEIEHANLRAALGWSLAGGDRARGRQGDKETRRQRDGETQFTLSPFHPFTLSPSSRGEIGVRLTSTLARFWLKRGYVSEAQLWAAHALEWRDHVSPESRAVLLVHAGSLAWCSGAYAEAIALSSEGLHLSRQFGDQFRVGIALRTLGKTYWYQGDLAQSQEHLEESLNVCRTAGDDWGCADACTYLALVAHNQRDYDWRDALFAESIALYRSCGDNAGVAEALNKMATFVSEHGDHSQVFAWYEEALALYRALGDRTGIGHVLHRLGDIAHDQGELDRARDLFNECLAIFREIGDTTRYADALIGFGDVVFKQGDLALAERLFTESQSMYEERRDGVGSAWPTRGLARVARARGDLARSWNLFEESLTWARVHGNPWGLAVCIEGLAGALSALGQPQLAARLFGAACAFRDANRLVYILGSLPDYERDLAETRSRLGDAAFEAAFEAGRVVSIEHAITEAVREQGTGNRKQETGNR
jgi:predicted ATPase/class 3 adenylate cyclase